MLRQSLPVGTAVWHIVAGIGIFRGYSEKGDAVVDFGDEVVAIPRKELIEVEKPDKNIESILKVLGEKQ